MDLVNDLPTLLPMKNQIRNLNPTWKTSNRNNWRRQTGSIAPRSNESYAAKLQFDTNNLGTGFIMPSVSQETVG